MALLNNTTKPTPREVQALIALHDSIRPCRIEALEGYGKVHPAYVSLYAEAFSRADDDLLSLIQGRITWGQHAKLVQENMVELQAGFAKVSQEINYNLANAHTFEVQQRQAAAQALSAWAAQQQQIQAQQNIANAINRPRYTQCRYVGVYLQCNTF